MNKLKRYFLCLSGITACCIQPAFSQGDTLSGTVCVERKIMDDEKSKQFSASLTSFLTGYLSKIIIPDSIYASGKVYVQFITNQEAQILRSSIQIVRGIHPVIDQLVLEAMLAYPDQTEEKKEEETYTRFTFPVKFEYH